MIAERTTGGGKMRKPMGACVITALCLACLFTPGTPARGAEQRGILAKRTIAEIGQAQAQEETKTTEETPKKFETVPGKVPMLERAVDPDSYVLGPYDELAVSIMGPEPRDFSLTVLPEGDVVMPGVGSIHADGLTLTEFRRALAAKVEQYFRNIGFYCYLKAPAIFRVFVTGEVRNPGAVEVSGVERVTDAIEKAGNVTGSGSRRLITVERGRDTLRVDLLAFLEQGDFESNPYLRSGDRVHVPVKSWQASIFGQVNLPGIYEIIEGETVRDLIGFAGGFTTDAFTDSVLVSSVGANGELSTASIPASELGMVLKDMDEVAVYDRLKDRLQVHVEGAVKRTGRFYLAPGEGLDELIVRTGGFTDRADLAHAYIEGKKGAVRMVNLPDYLSPDPSKNLTLEDGDVLTIPRIPSTITVGGEVNNPGEFNYNSEFTVAQYVGLAGGPTKDGSIDRVVLYSPGGKARRVDRGMHPARGDVIIVKRSAYSIVGEVAGGIIRLGTVVISIIVLTK
jgi:polysaccharide export outer membrane protein